MSLRLRLRGMRETTNFSGSQDVIAHGVVPRSERARDGDFSPDSGAVMKYETDSSSECMRAKVLRTTVIKNDVSDSCCERAYQVNGVRS